MKQRSQYSFHLECLWHHLVKLTSFMYRELPGMSLTSPCQINEIQVQWNTWNVSDITLLNKWDSGTVNYLECLWHHLVKLTRFRYSQLPGVFLTSSCQTRPWSRRLRCTWHASNQQSSPPVNQNAYTAVTNTRDQSCNQEVTSSALASSTSCNAGSWDINY